MISKTFFVCVPTQLQVQSCTRKNYLSTKENVPPNGKAQTEASGFYFSFNVKQKPDFPF